MEEERSSRAPIDLSIFQSLELKSIELTQQLNEQVASIQQQMNKMSTSTVAAGKAYKLSVENLTGEIDTSTKKSIELITQCDELDKDLSQLRIISKQIKAVDKALDQLQHALKPRN